MGNGTAATWIHGVAIVVFSAGAHAQALDFDVPAGSLGAALDRYAQQARVQLIYRASEVEAVATGGASGAMSPDDALARILGGSGFQARRDGSGAIAIVRDGDRLRSLRRDPWTQPSPGIRAPRQEGAAPLGAGRLPEVVVTAEKRADNLQHTSISMVAMDDESLEERGIQSLNDFVSSAVPALRIAPFVGRWSALTVGMRGLVPIDATQVGRDPTVGIYVDGVYLGRVQGLGTELLDVERIEVLRGPQGTLFGRNAVGGALNIVSRTPTGDFGIDLAGGIGSFARRRGTLRVNLPEVANVSVKLYGAFNEDDGWVKNSLAGQQNWHRINRHGFQGQALWRPAPSLSFRYDFDSSIDKSTPGYSTLVSLTPTSAPLAPVFAVEHERVRTARGGFVMAPSTGKVEGHALRAEWESGDAITLRSITARRTLDQDQWDQTAGVFFGFTPNGTDGRLSYANVRQEQFSEELQLIGSTERLDFLLGAFHFHEDGYDEADAPNTIQYNASGTAYVQIAYRDRTSPRFPDRSSQVRTRSDALFAQATWTPPTLGDRLHLTGGLRYAHERKSGHLLKVRGVPVEDAATIPPLAYRTERLDPAATLAFDFADDVRAYVKWGRAFRSGGANSRSRTFRMFEEEVNSSWEIGLKAELFDRRARVNIAAYTSRLRNPQIDFAHPLDVSNSETINGNAPEKVEGVEIDVTVAPGNGLTLNASYAYTDARFMPQRHPLMATPTFVSVDVAFTPKHAGSVSLDYRFPSFGFAALTLHLDGNFAGRQYVTAFNSKPTRRSSEINGRLTLGDMKFRRTAFEVSAWVRNLTNEQHDLWNYTRQLQSQYNLLVFNAPRSIGVDAKLSFREGD